MGIARILAATLCATAVVVLAALALLLRRRQMHLWLPAWVRKRWAGARERQDGPIHILFCLVDHYEPAHERPGRAREGERVTQWHALYPRLADRFRDAEGNPPKHTFFYPEEEYRPEHLSLLAELTARGYGEVEIHLHHKDDTSENLRATLTRFKATLREHGLLGADRSTGEARFGFIHGNWSLDNSLPDGDWCGVNDELIVLKECGCYADFTLPSAPSAAQTRRINSIYYATDDAERPKSHDDGVEVRVDGAPTGDLMIIQGPLALRWPGHRLGGLAPVIENGNLAAHQPPTPERVDQWVRTRVCVAGRPEWVFVKVHTHGCNDANLAMLLGGEMDQLHQHLTTRYNDGSDYCLHYVTAREMYNIVKAAESGESGNPADYRDFLIAPPPCRLPRREQGEKEKP